MEKTLEQTMLDDDEALELTWLNTVIDETDSYPIVCKSTLVGDVFFEIIHDKTIDKYMVSQWVGDENQVFNDSNEIVDSVQDAQKVANRVLFPKAMMAKAEKNGTNRNLPKQLINMDNDELYGEFIESDQQ